MKFASLVKFFVATLAAVAILFATPTHAQFRYNALAVGNGQQSQEVVVAGKLPVKASHHEEAHDLDMFQIVVIIVVSIIVLVGIALIIYLCYSGSSLEKRIKSRRSKTSKTSNV